MRRTRTSLRDLLADLVAWGEAAERMARRTSRETIAQDEQAELALSRAVEIVGEVSGRLLALFPERWNEEERLELRNAYRTRNKLAHGYDDISPQILFDITLHDIGRLAGRARVWLARLDDQS